MAWRTPIGKRTLQGHEAELIRQAIAVLYDYMSDEYEAGIKGLFLPTGVTQFDTLQIGQRLFLLDEVGHALLEPSVASPNLTSPREATIAAMFAAERSSLEMEIESQTGALGKYLLWRPLVLAEFRKIVDVLKLPDVSCTCLEEWEILLDCLSDRVLWDDDWTMEGLFIDSPPELAADLRELMKIPDGYYSHVPPDPMGPELLEIRSRMEKLIERSDFLH